MDTIELVNQFGLIELIFHHYKVSFISIVLASVGYLFGHLKHAHQIKHLEKETSDQSARIFELVKHREFRSRAND